MQERPPISQDDLTDVIELTDKLAKSLNDILAEVPKNLSISSVMSASINFLISQCENDEELLFHRNLFIRVLAESISDEDETS